MIQLYFFFYFSQVVISLLIYALFMIDAFRTTVWEPLDDYVYVIKATGSSIEFLFGIFLFFNGAWILLFESGGTIRAIMMCIHAYFNIWLQAKLGMLFIYLFIFFPQKKFDNLMFTFHEF